jgi:hypothetical protein
MESSDGFSGSVRVRNLSAAGMGAKSGHAFRAGEKVVVALPNIGAVAGRVIWSRAGAFGVLFERAIDPELARQNKLEPFDGPGAVR